MTAPPLNIMLAAARAELFDETPTRLHTDHISTLLDADGSVTKDTDVGGVGLPFTAEFHSLLALRERYRPQYPMRNSMSEVTDWCLRQHPTHEDGLCGRVLVLAVRWAWGTDQISGLVLYPEPVVRSILIGALRHAADWRQVRLRPRKKSAADLVIESQNRRRSHASNATG